MRRPDVSDEIWILAPDRTMGASLEIGHWLSTFAEHGLFLVPCLSSELRLVTGRRGAAVLDLDGSVVTPPHLCVVRTFERYAAHHLELMGTTCLSSSAVMGACYDRALAAQLIAGTGVAMVDGEVVPRLTPECAVQSVLGARFGTYPQVVRFTGHGDGQGAEVVGGSQELFDRMDEFSGRSVFAQPLVSSGTDVRVYVIGGSPRYALEGTGLVRELPGTYDQGSDVRRIGLTGELVRYCRRILSALPGELAFGALDFRRDDDGLVFCEVNASIDCRIPRECCNLDLVGIYADWIRRTYVV